MYIYAFMLREDLIHGLSNNFSESALAFVTF